MEIRKAGVRVTVFVLEAWNNGLRVGISKRG